MVRQNRSEVSSTSRCFSKTALLRARRKTFQFSDEQAHGTFSLRNHFSSFPRFRPKSWSQAPPASAILFSKEPVFLMPARPNPFALDAAREIGCARGPPPSFRGNQFPSFLPAEIGCPATPADRLAENHC